MPGQRIDYLRELGQARARTIVDEKRGSASTVAAMDGTGCILFGGSRNTDGYGQVTAKKNSNLHLTGRSVHTAFLLHRVAYLARTGRDCVGHASHLCNRPACFNGQHIVDETAQQNNERKGCPGIIICGFHHHNIVDLCSHTPKCIRPERFDVSCCLALRESDPEGWQSSLPSEEVGESQGTVVNNEGDLPGCHESSDYGSLPDVDQHVPDAPSTDYGEFPSETGGSWS